MSPDPTLPTVDNLSVQDRFELAIETASYRAAQRVARIHRLRLVRWTFLAAMLTTLVVVLILWFVLIQPDQRGFTRKGAAFNCALVTQLSGSMSDFVKTDVTLRQQQLKLSERQEILTKENQIFGKTEVGRLIKESNNITQTAINRWEQTDIPQLKALGGIDCQKHLGG